MAAERKQFCEECRKETTYTIKKEKCIYCIRGKEYSFDVAVARCVKCGEEVYLPGLMDYNAALVDQQFRKAENLISVDDIYTLMEVYNIGKAPLSLALGFGEITITRYLQGQYPSDEYSGVIRSAFENPEFMMKCLDENREKVGDTAYKKSWKAAMALKKLVESVSEKMLITISYIFERVDEITPLALQKILYYAQGIYLVNQGKALFEEECRAWVHGPVYEDVYAMFKEFKYNPIEDKRFIIFRDRFQKLSADEKDVIDLVINTFGMYSGKTLERITHKEVPWIDAYAGEGVYRYTNEPITKAAIKKYFNAVSREFDLKSEEGISTYIRKQLNS